MAHQTMGSDVNSGDMYIKHFSYVRKHCFRAPDYWLFFGILLIILMWEHTRPPPALPMQMHLFEGHPAIGTSHLLHRWLTIIISCTVDEQQRFTIPNSWNVCDAASMMKYWRTASNSSSHQHARILKLQKKKMYTWITVSSAATPTGGYPTEPYVQRGHTAHHTNVTSIVVWNRYF